MATAAHDGQAGGGPAGAEGGSRAAQAKGFGLADGAMADDSTDGEDTSDEAYERLHGPLETAERMRFAAVQQPHGGGQPRAPQDEGAATGAAGKGTNPLLPGSGGRYRGDPKGGATRSRSRAMKTV